MKTYASTAKIMKKYRACKFSPRSMFLYCNV